MPSFHGEDDLKRQAAGPEEREDAGDDRAAVGGDADLVHAGHSSVTKLRLLRFLIILTLSRRRANATVLRRGNYHSADYLGGEETWQRQRRTRFAFGITATQRRRRGSTPRPSLTRPSMRFTTPRATSRQGRKGT